MQDLSNTFNAFDFLVMIVEFRKKTMILNNIQSLNKLRLSNVAVNSCNNDFVSDYALLQTKCISKVVCIPISTCDI